MGVGGRVPASQVSTRRGASSQAARVPHDAGRALPLRGSPLLRHMLPAPALSGDRTSSSTTGPPVPASEPAWDSGTQRQPPPVARRDTLGPRRVGRSGACTCLLGGQSLVTREHQAGAAWRAPSWTALLVCNPPVLRLEETRSPSASGNICTCWGPPCRPVFASCVHMGPQGQRRGTRDRLSWRRGRHGAVFQRVGEVKVHGGRPGAPREACPDAASPQTRTPAGGAHCPLGQC